MENVFEKVKPYMSKKGIDAVHEQGTSIITLSGDLETPLVNDKECVYVVFDDKGVACCAIEQAYNAGVIDWKNQFHVICILFEFKIIQSFLRLIMTVGLFVVMLVVWERN